jgi:hypothetical protein
MQPKKFLCKVPLDIGTFATPALHFFAITGAMQTFSLQETTPGQRRSDSGVDCNAGATAQEADDGCAGAQGAAG